MQITTPAVVTQAAFKRFPRAALLGLCIVYVLAGFIGRGGWKSADMAALGFMVELAAGRSNWWHPTLLGIASEYDALLPYWLGAWMLQLAPNADVALWLIRIPFALLLALAGFYVRSIATRPRMTPRRSWTQKTTGTRPDKAPG